MKLSRPGYVKGLLIKVTKTEDVGELGGLGKVVRSIMEGSELGFQDQKA